MEHYIYEGPVLGLSRVITEKWRGETYAISKRKAMGNLAYQFKRQHGLSKSAKIFLPMELTKD